MKNGNLAYYVAPPTMGPNIIPPAMGSYMGLSDIEFYMAHPTMGPLQHLNHRVLQGPNIYAIHQHIIKLINTFPVCQVLSLRQSIFNYTYMNVISHVSAHTFTTYASHTCSMQYSST